NSNGVKHQNAPLRFGAVTTPAYGDRIRAAWGMRILFEPGKVIQMRVTGQVAGPVPATVSITFIGQMGWGRRWFKVCFRRILPKRGKWNLSLMRRRLKWLCFLPLLLVLSFQTHR